MTPSPNTTEPRNSPQNLQLQGLVHFVQSSLHPTEISVDVADTSFTDYKLYAASSDPNPRADTEPLDEEPVTPPAGRLIGDGQYVEQQEYTVQVTFRDQNGNPRCVTGSVPAQDALPNTSVAITLS